MNKYNIEGGIDFYAELYKSLDIDEGEEKNDNKEKCLISNKILTEKYITMKCGHKFNYIPLYYDLLNHKQKFNSMEGSNRLQLNQIRCPYCSKKQNELLPYYQELGLNKVNGVNYFDPNIKENHNHHYYNSPKCAYQIINQSFDNSKPESEQNKKYYTCGTGFSSKIQIYNALNPSEPITYNDDNLYCYCHKKIMIKQYKTEEKEKKKLLEKIAKESAKAEIKAAKELEKQKLKEVKQILKKEIKAFKKNLVSENIVLGPSDINIKSEHTGCVQILKT